ncbi:hypothetical protein D3C72_1176540 [compost metagenome]
MDGAAPAACLASISTAAFSDFSVPSASRFLESAIQSTSTWFMAMSDRPERRARSRKLSSALVKTEKPILRPGISTVAEMPPGEPPPWVARRSPR